MLIIYQALPVGGIETQFLRLAKYRHSIGLKTKVLLLLGYDNCNLSLLNEFRKYADVYTLSDFYRFKAFYIINKLAYHLCLLIPLDVLKVSFLLKDITHIHVTNIHAYHFAQKIILKSATTYKISMGIYHSGENTWNGHGSLPYYEVFNRSYLINKIKKENVFLFNESVKSIYINNLDKNFVASPCFPLGVINKVSALSRVKESSTNNSNHLKIISIGRLESFKTYNLWMLDVVNSLVFNGYKVTYDIYGTGNIEEQIKTKILDLNLGEIVSLKGTLSYDKFDDTVSQYDLFVGSGTAIIQAAANGIPSIIGVENNLSPTSYGYISQIQGFAYNEDNLYEKYSVLQLIEKFISLTENEKDNLRCSSVKKAQEFSIENFHKAFEIYGLKSSSTPCISSSKYFIYTFSFLFYPIFLRIFGKSLGDYMYSSQHNS